MYHSIFDNLRRKGRKAVIPYFTAFYPSQKVFEKSVIIASESGADIIEIGLPFSDPLADGPVIQHASHYALTHGFTIKKMFQSISDLRKKVSTPFIIMSYLNPILKYGVMRFLSECQRSGVRGLIVPDMTPEEGGMLEESLCCYKIATNYLVAPTTPEERIRYIASKTTGFIYLVSVIGVTGEREGVPDYLPAIVRKIRRITDKPLCIGFGISTPEQAKEVAKLCDGVIIGSALVRRTSPKDVGKFLRETRKSI
ncbi:MAG: tryptophan synthase subunit alpha [Planctomycetota bacterium]|nr:tryptophan synthase subunit alpha [Planctomycetota bacterium]